jgi:NADH-quinone oxidoreductase subunit J
MLVNLDQAARLRQFNKQWWLAIACALGVGAAVFYFIRKGAGAFQLAAPAVTAPAAEGNTERIADVLFSQYLLPFEVASILLLVAIVGSVIMAKKRV